MILRFEGVVVTDGQTVTIGDRDVIAEVSEAEWRDNRVTVALADERFDGDLYAVEGSRWYSEWTPGEPPEFKVGKHDVWDRLDDLDGKHVTLWVADEPVNVLAKTIPNE